MMLICIEKKHAPQQLTTKLVKRNRREKDEKEESGDEATCFLSGVSPWSP